MSLTVHWESGGSSKLERIEVSEFPDRVEVGVVEKTSTGFNTADLRYEHAPAALSAPLGDRAVIDAAHHQADAPDRAVPRRAAVSRPPEPTRSKGRSATARSAACPPIPRTCSGGSTAAASSRARRSAGCSRSGRSTTTTRSRRTCAATAPTTAATRSSRTYPAKPTIVYRFVRNTAKHEAAIKRRSRHPKQIRTETVTFTTRGHRASEGHDRGRRDAPATASSTATATRASTSRALYFDDMTAKLILLVRTPRTDATAYFAARYGPLVAVEVVGDRFECRRPSV